MSAPKFDPNKATSSYNPNQPITPPKGVAPKPSKISEKTTTVTAQTLAHTSPVVVRGRKGSTRSPLPDFSNMTTGLSNSTPPQTPSRAYEFARESARKAKASAQKVKMSANEALELVAAEAPDRLQTPSKISLQITGGVDEKFVKARDHQRGNSYREAPPAMQSPAKINTSTSSLDEPSGSNTNGEIAKRLDFGISALSTATSSSSTTTAPKAKPNNRGSLSIKGKSKTMLDAVEALMGLLKNLGSIRSDEEFKFYATNIMDLTNLYFESKESLKGARKTTRVGSVGIQGKEFAKRRLNSEDKKSAFDISMQNFLMGNLIEFTKSKHWKKFPVKTECSGLKISSQAKRLLKWVPLEKLTMQPLENLQELRKAIGNFIQLIRTQITNIKTGIDFNLWDGKTKRTAFEKKEAERLNIPLELYVLLHNLHQELAAEQPEKEEQKKEFYEVYLNKCIELLTYYAFCLDHLRENEFKDSSELNQRAFKRLSQASSKRVLVVEEPKPGSSIEIPSTSRRGTISLRNPALLNYLEPLFQQIEALANLDLLDIVSPKVNQVEEQMLSIRSKALAIIETLSDQEEKNFESFLSTSDIAPICYSKVRNSAEHDALVKFMESLLPYIKHPFPTRTKKASYNAASLADWLSLKDLTKSEYVSVHQFKNMSSYLLVVMDEIIDNIRTKGMSAFDLSLVPPAVVSIYNKLYALIVQYAEQSNPDLKTADGPTRAKAINIALEMRLNQLRTSLRDGYMTDFDDKLDLVRLDDNEIKRLEGCSTHEFERAGQLGFRTVQIAQVAKLYSQEELVVKNMKIIDTLPVKSNEWDAIFDGTASLSLHGIPEGSIDSETLYTSDGKKIKEADRAEHIKVFLKRLLNGLLIDKKALENIEKLADLFLQTKSKVDEETVLTLLGSKKGDHPQVESLISLLNSSKEKSITRCFECFASVLQAIIMSNDEHAWCEDIIKLLVVLAFLNQQSAFANYKAINALKMKLFSPESFVSTFKQNASGAHSLDNQQRMIYEIYLEKGEVRLVAKAFLNFANPNLDAPKIATGVAPLMYKEHYQLKIDLALFTSPEEWRPDYIGTIIRTTSDKESLKPYFKLKEQDRKSVV